MTAVATLTVQKACDDNALAAAIGTLPGARIHLFHGRWRFVMYLEGRADGLTGDLGLQSHQALIKAAQANRLFLVGAPPDQLDGNNIPLAWTSTNAPAASEAQLTAWVTERETLLEDGRGRSLTAAGKEAVFRDAAWHCMFEGCGKTLTKVFGSRQVHNHSLGYLAHIVASDPNGPRGDPEFSAELSDKPENVMLLCDEHHRLVDRIAPLDYPRERLESMRRDHVEKVAHLLSSLGYPSCNSVAILGDMPGQPVSIPVSDMHAAALGRKLHPVGSSIPRYLKQSQMTDRVGLSTWEHILAQLSVEVRKLKESLEDGGALSEGNRPLAIYALHQVPVLVLAGRIIGENRPTELFQYHRDRNSWQWSTNVPEPSPDKFGLSTQGGENEAGSAHKVLLTIETTARIDSSDLPQDLQSLYEQGQLPWVRVSVPTPSVNSISHPKDLDLFAAVARRALTQIHDAIRAKEVHLIGVSAAPCLLRIGQMLQAGSHPDYVIHHRVDRNLPFQPAIKLTGQSVESMDGTSKTTLPLR